MRSCGGTEHLALSNYHSGQTSDLLHVVRELRKRAICPSTGGIFHWVEMLSSANRRAGRSGSGIADGGMRGIDAHRFEGLLALAGKARKYSLRTAIPTASAGANPSAAQAGAGSLFAGTAEKDPHDLRF
jgi:hypothetical protein